MKLSAEQNSFYVAFGQLPPFLVNNNFQYVSSSDDLHDCLKDQIPKEPVGLMLSSGRDSMILASLLPKGSIAYTARANGRRDESIHASIISEKLGLTHKAIEIERGDYRENIPEMFYKDPLATCPWTYKIVKQAKMDGFNYIVSGTGTLASFGEEAEKHDYQNEPQEFLRRWSRLDPERILVDFVPLALLCKDYIVDGKIDTLDFMRYGRGEFITEKKTIEFLGLKQLNPYKAVRIDLDFERAKSEGKYMMSELYEKLYSEKAPPKRSPAVVDYKEWFSDWIPSHPNFRSDIDLTKLENRRWQLYKLEKYWEMSGS